MISTVSLHHLWERHVTLGSSISILLVNPSIPNDQKPVNNTTGMSYIQIYTYHGVMGVVYRARFDWFD